MSRKTKFVVGDIVKFRAPPLTRFNSPGTWIDLDDNSVEAGELGMIVDIREEEIEGDIYQVYDIMLSSIGSVSRGWDDGAFEKLPKKSKNK
jgi:hypothetical protein